MTKKQNCCCLVTCVCRMSTTMLLHIYYWYSYMYILSTILHTFYHRVSYYFLSCPYWCCYILRFNLICILYVIYGHVCCETSMLLSQLHPDLWRLDFCSLCKRSSSVGYGGETHSLNNCVFAENVLIKVDQRQARMWVGVNVMTLTIDFGIPPSLSQEFVP